MPASAIVTGCIRPPRSLSSHASGPTGSHSLWQDPAAGALYPSGEHHGLRTQGHPCSPLKLRIDPPQAPGPAVGPNPSLEVGSCHVPCRDESGLTCWPQGSCRHGSMSECGYQSATQISKDEGWYEILDFFACVLPSLLFYWRDPARQSSKSTSLALRSPLRLGMATNILAV